MVGLFRIIEGIALLTLGRKLFWLFVGLIGFEAGTQFASRMFVAMPEWMTLLIAMAVGLLGAILAIFLQNVVIVGAGFVAGGVIAAGIVDALGIQVQYLPIIAFILGGILGAILIAALFDWALIGLSSLIGAITLTNLFVPRGSLTVLAIIVLFILGVAIQAGWLWRERRRV
jgi:hypothetical protein